MSWQKRIVRLLSKSTTRYVRSSLFTAYSWQTGTTLEWIVFGDESTVRAGDDYEGVRVIQSFGSYTVCISRSAVIQCIDGVDCFDDIYIIDR